MMPEEAPRFIFSILCFMQSVQVLWARGASTCEDCGGMGQRDQGLVSKKGNDGWSKLNNLKETKCLWNKNTNL